MAKVGAYSPETAKMVLDVVRYLKQSGFTVLPPGSSMNVPPPQDTIYVENDSGEEVPPFAVMQAINANDIGGQNYITIDKTADIDESSGGFLFNGPAPIEIGGFGVAYGGPVARVLGDGSVVTAGDKWAPVINGWTIEPNPAGMFKIIGDDDIATNCVRVFASSTGGSSGNIFRFTLTSVFTAGVATADIDFMNGTTLSEGSSLRDPELIFSTLGIGDKGICFRDNGLYYVIQAKCPTP